MFSNIGENQHYILYKRFIMNVLEFKKTVSSQLRATLESAALAANYNTYVSRKGTRVGLEWASASDIDASELCSFIPFTPTGQLFTLFRAGNHIGLHVDDHQERTSCLSIALLPSLENFAPVTYYDKLGDDAVITETYHYTEHPVILNTANVHAMYNNQHDRYVFQIQYQEPIENFLPFADQI
jgi:hypothetical protein